MTGLHGLAVVGVAHLAAGALLAAASLKVYERSVALGLASALMSLVLVVGVDWWVGTELLAVSVAEMRQLVAVSTVLGVAGAVSVLLLFEAEPETQTGQGGSGGGSGEAADDPLEDVFDL